jgi:hypothetical protein
LTNFHSVYPEEVATPIEAIKSLNATEEIFNIMVPFGDDFYFVNAKEVFKKFNQVGEDLIKVSKF